MDSGKGGLSAGNNFFDDIGRFFGGDRDGQGDTSSSNSGSPTSSNDDPNVLFEIPAKSIKLGGLRLFLSLHLMGQQNSPTKGAWKVSTTEDSTINMIFNDETAGLVVLFTDEKLSVQRWGDSPSLQYLIQESVILNAFLDEVNAIVFDGEVREEDRLLVLEKVEDLEEARKSVAFS